MKILAVGLVKNEQLTRLKEEGEKRGHSVNGCYVSELILYADNNEFVPSLKDNDIADYDLIYLWAVGNRRWEWYIAAQFLNSSRGVKIVNRKAIDPGYNYYLSPAVDYLKQTKEGLPFPASALVFKSSSIDRVLERLDFPLIVKPSGGRQGRGVSKVNSRDELNDAVDTLLASDAPAVVIREFIPNDGDIRVFTVGYKAIGAMKRTPKQGDFRSNISQGGSGSSFDLEKYPEVRNIAEKLSEITRTEIAGVDIMLHAETGKPYILEINPGPQFTGFEKYTGINAAESIIKYFESL